MWPRGRRANPRSPGRPKWLGPSAGYRRGLRRQVVDARGRPGETSGLGGLARRPGLRSACPREGGGGVRPYRSSSPLPTGVGCACPGAIRPARSLPPRRRVQPRQSRVPDEVSGLTWMPHPFAIRASPSWLLRQIEGRGGGPRRPDRASQAGRVGLARHRRRPSCADLRRAPPSSAVPPARNLAWTGVRARSGLPMRNTGVPAPAVCGRRPVG
jgi:hypothetical protein